MKRLLLSLLLFSSPVFAEKYRWPETYLFPEKPNKDYSYFPSTAGTRCSYRKLTRIERDDYRKMALDTCRKSDLNTRRKFCYGWN